MLTKTKAIVLHAFKYGEAQMIVDLLTEECGRVSCIVKPSAAPRSKVRKQHFQPLTILDLVLDIRHAARLQRVAETAVAVPFTSLPFNPYKLSIAMFMAEFLRMVTRSEPVNGQLFTYIENGIRWFDECDGGFANFHLVFMMRLTKFLGFYPNTENYEPECWFDLRTSCFCRYAPLHHDALKPEDAARIGVLLRMNFSTMHLFKMSHGDRNRLVSVIISYYRLHLPDMGELKSLDVLQEIFS